MVGIYKFENKINHRIYIGQSKNIERRYKDHLNRAKNNHQGNSEFNSPLHCAIRKYGIENFNFSIVEECSEKELNEKEKYWISYYDSYNNGYNCTSGGDSSEHSIKFNEDFISQIQNILLTTTDTYESIHNKYNISIGRISEINTGKIWFNQQLSYPLRNTSAKQSLCIDCGKPTSGPRYIRCSSCSRKHTIVPLDKMLVTRDELKNLIRQYSFVEIGRKFSVTDNSIRKWCIKFNLPSRKKDIKQYTDEEWAKI